MRSDRQAGGSQVRVLPRLPLNPSLFKTARERVYISDRDNGRVEVFDSNGKFLKEWAGTGGASVLAMTKHQHLWVGNVLFDLEGKPVGRLPGNSAGHGGMALAANGDIYVAYLNGTAKKFVKQ